MSEQLYQTYSCLIPYREYLGLLKPSDILGVGTKAVVVRNKIENRVLKVLEKKDSYEDLKNEFHTHDNFRMGLHEGVEKGKVEPFIKIPEIKLIPKVDNPALDMECIEGQSLITHFLRHSFAKKIRIPEEKLVLMTDYELERYLIDECLIDEDDIFEKRLVSMPVVLKKMFPKLVTPVKKAIKYLEQEMDLEHDDLHTGNLMLSRNGDLYIIDFGG